MNSIRAQSVAALCRALRHTHHTIDPDTGQQWEVCPYSPPRLTDVELAALHQLGYDWFGPDHYDSNIAEAYRAGYRDGHTAATELGEQATR